MSASPSFFSLYVYASLSLSGYRGLELASSRPLPLAPLQTTSLSLVCVTPLPSLPFFLQSPDRSWQGAALQLVHTPCRRLGAMWLWPLPPLLPPPLLKTGPRAAHPASLWHCSSGPEHTHLGFCLSYITQQSNVMPTSWVQWSLSNYTLTCSPKHTLTTSSTERSTLQLVERCSHWHLPHPLLATSKKKNCKVLSVVNQDTIFWMNTHN